MQEEQSHKTSILQNAERLNIIRAIDVLFIDEIGQVPAELLSTIDMIIRRIRESDIIFGGVLIIGTMDHTQLESVNGKPFLLSSIIITCFEMTILEHPVRCAGDEDFIRLQKLLRLCHSEYSNEVIEELKELLGSVVTFVPNWDSEEIRNEAPAIETNQMYIKSIKNSIPASDIREKRAIDIEKIHNSHRDWLPAQPNTSKVLSRKVKEPESLLFCKSAIYEFTHNVDGYYSQSQMSVLCDLPSNEALQANRKIEVLAAPPGVHDLAVNQTLS